MDARVFNCEADLLALTGQAESTRLEFKGSALLEQPRGKFIETLSREISAFANTEGGQLIIGIREERKGKSRLAAGLDEGIDPSALTAEWFQQAVEGSISPYLPGIRFIRIPLVTHQPGKIAIVIGVPRGSTAYQANDRRYYARSEFEVRALPDHEIRLRMLRPRVAVARVEVEPVERLNIGDTFYKFRTVIHNVGDLTIRNCILNLTFQRDLACALAEDGTDKFIVNGTEVQFPFQSDDLNLPIYPGGSLICPGTDWMVALPQEVSFTETSLECRWKVYLDDAPPSSGHLQIAQLDFPLYEPPLPSTR